MDYDSHRNPDAPDPGRTDEQTSPQRPPVERPSGMPQRIVTRSEGRFAPRLTQPIWAIQIGELRLLEPDSWLSLLPDGTLMSYDNDTFTALFQPVPDAQETVDSIDIQQPSPTTANPPPAPVTERHYKAPAPRRTSVKASYRPRKSASGNDASYVAWETVRPETRELALRAVDMLEIEKKSTTEVAIAMGVSGSSILQYIKMVGNRNRGEKALKLINEGASVDEAAAAVDLPPHRVSDYIAFARAEQQA